MACCGGKNGRKPQALAYLVETPDDTYEYVSWQEARVAAKRLQREGVDAAARMVSRPTNDPAWQTPESKAARGCRGCR